MKNHSISNLLLFLILFFSSIGFSLSNTITLSTTLTVVGLPAGAQLPLRFAPNYTTVTYIATNYTTNIPIYISPSTNSLYSGKVPYQWQGAGTTVTYNGVTYTMLPSTYTQLLNVGNDNILGFYTYLNSSLWNANETAELKAVNSSLTTARLIIAQLQNTTANVIYNGSKKAGAVSHIASYKNISLGSDISFIKQTVQPYPDAACIYINLAPSPFCANATTPDRISVPVINGHYGLTQSTTYPLIIRFKASLYGSQTAPFNYSVKDITSNTLLIPLTTTTTNSLNVTQTFNIPVKDSVEITAGNGGNANYSKQYIDPLTVPTNIIAYLPITFTNYQDVAVAANTPLAVGTTSSGNIIGFNALAYQQYETCNLNNGEFFLSNGTVLNSWMEGNIINEQTSNALCSSDSSANALADSANILYWVKIPTSSFLTANTGTATTNTIYLGWTGNVISSANTLLTSGSGAGEAPQLSSTYAEYDNGASVFTDYWNFAGTSLPSAYTYYCSGCSGAYTVDNGLTVNIGSVYSSVTEFNSANSVLEAALLYTGYIGAVGYRQSGLSQGTGTALTGSNVIYNLNTGPTLSQEMYAGTGGFDSNIYNRLSTFDPAANQLFVSSQYVSYNTIVPESNYYDYNSIIGSTSWNSPEYIILGSYEGSGSSTEAIDTVTYQWVRERPYVTDGFAPTTATGAVVTLTYPSNFVETGLPSATSWNVIYDGSTGSSTTNTISISSPPGNYLFTISSQKVGSTLYVPSPSSGYVVAGNTSTITFTGIPQLRSVSFSSSNSLIEETQYQTLNAVVSGGVTPYTYNFLVYNAIGSLVTNALYSTSSTSNTFTYSQLASWGIGKFTANVIITDSESPTASVSNSLNYGSNTFLIAPTPFSSPNTIGQGSDSILTENVPSTGTSPYTYQWLEEPPGSTSYSAISGATSNTYTFATSGSTAAGIYNFSIQVTDSATTKVTSVSSPTSVNVNPTLSTPTISPSNPTIDSGQSVTFTSTWSGGTPDYTAKLYSSTTSTCNTGSTLVQTLSSLTSGSASFSSISPTSITYYCIFVTDSAPTPETSNSISRPVIVYQHQPFQNLLLQTPFLIMGKG